MPIPYQVLGEFTGSVESGSFLDPNDTSLFYLSQSNDIWFSLSNKDVIEISTFTSDEDMDLINWGTIYIDKETQITNLNYLNNLNAINSYSYSQIVSPFITYKNSILLNTISDLSSINSVDSSSLVSYNFIRQMAGDTEFPLTIKEISPSRTEIKLIPTKDSIEYDAFCLSKFPIKDVATILISITKNLQYDKIFESMSSLPQYEKGISFIQFVFFLNNNASIVNFLRNMYEDNIKYSDNPPVVNRIQGIRTYYTNYLLQNYESVSDFDSIRKEYSYFVRERVNQSFSQVSGSTSDDYKQAKTFCHDYFIKYFYDVNVNSLSSSYEDKYFGYLKNVLNFGSGSYFQILKNGYIDEREVSTDPLTLILKMSSGIPSEISVKDECWVSNFGSSPFVFNGVFQNTVSYNTIKIGPPNFGSTQKFISKDRSNVLYSSDDLSLSSTTKNQVKVNKNIDKLNIDYTDYYNFIVFSSAETRLGIFKNKMVSLSSLSASLNNLNITYSNSLLSPVPYPFYLNEKNSIISQSTEIINSFDGYESYLYKEGNYQYNVSENSFYDGDYVSSQDIIAFEYDSNNRDSLVSNIPDYIKNNQSDYQDYLTFLNMIGHHFDDIYVYISGVPIERQLKNQISSSIPINTLKETLYSFGWNVNDIISSMNIDDVYLNSMDSSSYNNLSGNQRLQTIWNRILVTLPGIYKTKGTSECVRYLMSCYGLPSSLISIREYGGTDYSDDTSPTYQLDEKTYMLTFSGVGDYVEGPIPYSTNTVEFKFSVDFNVTESYYSNFKVFPLFTSIPYPYSSSSNFNWLLGIYKTPGLDTGKVIFQMGSGSSQYYLTSSVLPIFNGDIFSVMLRRDEPFNLFQSSQDTNVIPLEYDLEVKRSEDGRNIFSSTSSIILYDNDNLVFSQFGRFRLSNGLFKGNLDKLLIWDVPISDDDFQEHVDDLNSYGYSGSLPYQHLWIRLNWSYPQNMYNNVTTSSIVWINNESPFYNIPNYYVDQTFTSVNPTLYSSSLNIIQNNWSSFYPIGSVDIFGYNFPEFIDDSFSSSYFGFPNCLALTQSVYPYHFEELTYQQNMDTSKFGPNQYKNVKVNSLTQEVDVRFDSVRRSTTDPTPTVSGESNQLGFFIDPQDYKNRDMIRYVGKSGIMSLIGDPSNLYNDRYDQLINKNYEYNTNGNKKTYFNELLTVYKFYFEKSIFESIKNVIPARANVYTGVVIEPTILERPKYQNKPITSSVIQSLKREADIRKTYSIGSDVLWSDFNTNFGLINEGSTNLQNITNESLPKSYTENLNLKYLSDPIMIKSNNILGFGYIPNAMDDIQFSFYPDFENLPRLWETSSNGLPLPNNFTTPIYGSVSSNKLSGRFMVGGDHGVNYSNQYFSGSNRGNHPIIYYMVKIWDKYFYYEKTGEYVRSTNPSENHYSSASFYLYKYAIFDEYYMRNLIYFTDRVYLPVYDTSSVSYEYTSGLGYNHKVNTFLNTPDQITSNINAASVFNFTTITLGVNAPNQYFELVRGVPRNHYTHKSQQFSKSKYGTSKHILFIKGQQTSNTTVNQNGINDGSSPITSTVTNNGTVVNNSNIIQSVPSPTSGQVIPQN